MNDYGQHYGDLEFADNPDPRCACILLLDTSASMQGEKILALNEGIKTLKDTLIEDPIAARRVEIAVITFNSDVQILQNFVTVDQFDPPTLTAQGQTAMGKGIMEAIQQVERRKDDYKRHGIQYYRPWIFMITDGEPTDSVEAAAKAIREHEENKSLVFFAVGVEGANMDKLAQISYREPRRLEGLNFQDLFLWLSHSLQAVSNSRIGEQVALPSTDSWSSI